MASRSLRSEPSRRRILERIDRLSPDPPRHWGTMDPDLLLQHMARGLRRALGEIPSTSPPEGLGTALRRFLFVHVLPWPKGKIKSPAGAFDMQPGEWVANRQELMDLIERFAKTPADQLGQVHPVMGRMSCRDWDVLMYRHLDHHLRQFGG